MWLAAPLTRRFRRRGCGRQAPALLALALLNNVAPFSLLTWSQTHLASGLVSILNATTPVFTVVVAHLFTVEEKLDPRRLAGALIGVAGVAAMIGPALLGGFADHLVAELAALLAALSYAAASVFARRFRRLGLTPIERRDRPGHGVEPRASAARGAGRRALAAARAGRRGDRRDRLRMGALSTALAYVVYLPHPRRRRRGQCRAGDPARAGDRDPARRRGARRTARGPGLLRPGGLIALGLAVIDGRLPREARARLAAAFDR